MIWRIVLRGLSDEIGSWNTYWMRLPKTAGSALSSAAPSISMVPVVGSSSPTSIRASVDLPQPLSPTMPSVSPC
jgi:hypothetical protein